MAHITGNWKVLYWLSKTHYYPSPTGQVYQNITEQITKQSFSGLRSTQLDGHICSFLIKENTINFNKCHK